jgi:hypothetical protein
MGGAPRGRSRGGAVESGRTGGTLGRSKAARRGVVGEELLEEGDGGLGRVRLGIRLRWWPTHTYIHRRELRMRGRDHAPEHQCFPFYNGQTHKYSLHTKISVVSRQSYDTYFGCI